MKFHIERADPPHKWVGIFEDDETTKRIPFGASGYQDFTQHKNPIRRSMYLARHKAREDWTNPMSAGALSKWILWGESTNLEKNVRDFKTRFNLT